jgi:uncharacterized protein DUF6968
MKRFGRVIASRELSRKGGRSPLVVEIGIPRPRRTGEWECPYRIRGLKPQRARRALGEDAVQALELVFQAIRLELEPLGKDVALYDQPGETGFSRFFPDIFGPVVRGRVERLIDRELTREGRRLKRRPRKKR